MFHGLFERIDRLMRARRPTVLDLGVTGLAVLYLAGVVIRPPLVFEPVVAGLDGAAVQAVSRCLTERGIPHRRAADAQGPILVRADQKPRVRLLLELIQADLKPDLGPDCVALRAGPRVFDRYRYIDHLDLRDPRVRAILEVLRGWKNVRHGHIRLAPTAMGSIPPWVSVLMRSHSGGFSRAEAQALHAAIVPIVGPDIAPDDVSVFVESWGFGDGTTLILPPPGAPGRDRVTVRMAHDIWRDIRRFEAVIGHVRVVHR
ncbi:hypothetical protein F1188_08815 [Roseospira marina]|uniref:Uncharacterized protein n=1 Tax=Roseospira marina TaxID=140057 RepID=A0A5M6ICL4_9PROT|nr:hypothetical protein [Roseospira marina]KAA5605717.1 hypothetical protein F1188_08815 [Roseospira marina]MBB4313518.1 hypothetical protein [Roseospira marina]MBB5086680.1 hypothetical protein [Roseospira marina]